MNFETAVTQWVENSSALCAEISVEKTIYIWEKARNAANFILGMDEGKLVSDVLIFIKYHKIWTESIKLHEYLCKKIQAKGGDPSQLVPVDYPKWEPNVLESALLTETSAEKWKSLIENHFSQREKQRLNQSGSAVFLCQKTDLVFRNLKTINSQSLTAFCDVLFSLPVRFLHFHFCSFTLEAMKALKSVNHPKSPIEVIYLYNCDLDKSVQLEAGNIRVLYRVEE